MVGVTYVRNFKLWNVMLFLGVIIGVPDLCICACADVDISIRSILSLIHPG